MIAKFDLMVIGILKYIPERFGNFGRVWGHRKLT